MGEQDILVEAIACVDLTIFTSGIVYHGSLRRPLLIVCQTVNTIAGNKHGRTNERVASWRRQAADAPCGAPLSIALFYR